MNMPGIYTSIIRRHPTLDPTPSEPVEHTDPQPGTSGQMSPRPRRYMWCHRDGGGSQGGTRHSMPPARRQGGFNFND